MKVCARCKLPKEKFHTDASKPDGLTTVCADCRNASARRNHEANREARNAWQRAYAKTHREGYTKRAKDWRHKHLERMRDRYLRNTYGLSEEEYQALLRKQDNKCAICRCELPPGVRFDVDHAHDTNAVRGLLCRTCNVGIGALKDDPQLLRSAVGYLENRQ